MKIFTKGLAFLFTTAFILTGCDVNDANDDPFSGSSITYNLHEAGDSNISGVVTFEELENGNTLVTIQLNGTETGNSHPAHIHNNSVAEGGGVAVPLSNVNGDSGESETEVQESYSTLVNFNGHVNVHRSGEDLAVIAEGNIGANSDNNPGNSSGTGTGTGNGSGNGGDDY